LITNEDDGSLFACYGVMGGFMQPQGHVQVAVGLIDDGLDPQAALDRLRFCIEDGTSSGTVAIEEGVPPQTLAALEKLGHHVKLITGMERALFGRGQVIVRDKSSGVLWGGSDPRADGLAMAS
jgi:gamma-glutamyltranspeptidase/glutathione hydrolase